MELDPDRDTVLVVLKLLPVRNYDPAVAVTHADTLSSLAELRKRF
jgi:hypothetical protein